MKTGCPRPTHPLSNPKAEAYKSEIGPLVEVLTVVSYNSAPETKASVLALSEGPDDIIP